MTAAIVVSCEHGGNRVPKHLRKHFARRERWLSTHRGYDPGALTIAKRLARQLDAPLHASTISRLVVELNRSVGHPRLFSSVTRDLPEDEREHLLASIYRPYREALEQELRDAIARNGRVLHLSSHTFTPVYQGERRKADIGLLYDPARRPERDLAERLTRALRASTPWVIRRNYPYLGKADGLTTSLRRVFPASRYLGFELEVNQRFARGDAERLPEIADAIARAVAECR